MKAQMKAQIQKFLKEEDGITALEYGILAAIVAVLIATVFHDGIEDVFDAVITKLTDCADGSCSA